MLGDIIRALLKVQKATGDVKAIKKGPEAYGKRVAKRTVHRQAHKTINKLFK